MSKRSPIDTAATIALVVGGVGFLVGWLTSLVEVIAGNGDQPAPGWFLPVFFLCSALIFAGGARKLWTLLR